MPIQVPVVQTGLEQSIQQAASKVGKNLRINMGPGAKSIESLAKPLGRLTGKADEFTKSMEAANARVLAFGASVGVIAAVSNGLKELVSTTIQVEKSLANINSILGQTSSQLNSFKNEIFDIARNTGQTFDTVAEAALELSRQGLKAEEVTRRLNDALVLSRLSGLSAADSVAGLTAAVNSFSSAGLTTTDVLNKISAAAASAAVSDRDLIEGLKRSGAVAVASGVQFDELIGIISALQEKTSRGGAVIGNSLKTIFTRIQDLDRLNTLQDLGVQVTDLQGKVLSSNKIIENLGPIFAKLDQSSKVNLADNLVGKFQIAPFLALLEDYNGGISRSGEVANISLNATSEAYERNAVLSKTLAAAVNTATVNLKELANTLGEIGVTENLSNIIGVFNSVVSSIQDILDGDGIGSKFAKGLIKGIGGVLAGPGLALALVAIGKLLLDFAKFGAGALKTFFGLNKAAQEQAALQGQITASLLNDKGIRSAILSIEKQNISEAEKKKLQTAFFTKALNEQLAIMQKMQGIARTVAPGVMAGTASRRGRRAAGGFLPIGAESSDISRGVGGAPASAKPVVIPNFAFGGGKRGTMVANDSEYIVPNYANGGDAIFNQNMVSSMGLPANARKVRAASGFIPNFASTTIQDIIAKPKNFIHPDGTFKSKKASNLYALGSASQKAAIDVYRKAKGTAGSSTVIIPAQRYGVASVFPEKKTANSSASPSTLTSPIAKAAAAQGISNIKFQGIQIGSIHDAKQNLEKKKNEFKNQIADLFVNPVAQLGANVIGASFQGNDKRDLQRKVSKIRGKDNDQGVNLFSSSVEGGIFEAAIRLITKKTAAIEAFKQEKDDQKPFDFEEGSGRPNKQFRRTFGFSDRLIKADAKRTASNEAVRTVIAKAFNDPSQKDFLVKQIKKVKPTFKAAGGYIPNFAEGALEEAIGREKAAGLPVSQIRINQSGKLRNAQNPMGLAVTNTRDEPTGAIPNFAKSKDADALGNAGMKAMVLASGLAFVSSAFEDTSEAQDKASESIIKFTDVLDMAMTAVMTHSLLSMMPTKSISSKIQSKGGMMELSGFSMGSKGQVKGGIFGGLMQGAGKLTRLFSGLVKFVGKLIPFIGPFIIGFQVLSGVMKKFGIDFKGVGSILMNGLKKFGNLIMDVGAFLFKGISSGVKTVLKLVSELPFVGDSAKKGLDFINNIQNTLDTQRFETDTFSESFRKAREASSARESGTSGDIKAAEKREKIEKDIQRIRLSTAKQALDSSLKLAKLELTRKGESQIALERAKALKNVSFERLQALERAAELEKFNAETSGLLLDNIIQSATSIKGVTATVERQAAAQEAVKEAMKDGNISRKDALNIATQLTEMSDQNERLNKVVAENIKDGADQLMRQRDLQKEINQGDLIRRQELEKQLEVARKLGVTLRNQSAKNLAAMEAGRVAPIGSAREDIQFFTEQKRGASRSRQFELDIKIAKKNNYINEQRSEIALQRLINERDFLKKQRDNAAALKLSSGKREEIQNRLFLLDTELINTQRERNKIQKTLNEQNIKMLEKGRVLQTAMVNLTNEFDNFAISQKKQNAALRVITGATQRDRKLADFQLAELGEAEKLKSPKERAEFLRDAPLRRTMDQRRELLKKSDLEISSQLKDNLVQASEQFRNNFASAFTEGIKSVDSLKDALLNAANQFLQSMTKSFAQKFMDQAASEGGGGFIGRLFGFSDGGKVRGGSGSRDDVPAMLMGGEFVMNKRAVQRYGSGFMEALNSGSVRGYARGGQVRDEEGMFTTPGMRGAGSIVGGANLMSFATQTPIALGRDTLTSRGAFLGAESGRFTMFGRRNNPQFQKVQDAKRQAFDLAIKERQAYEQAEAQKVSLGSMLASAAISTLVSFGTSKLLGGLKGANGEPLIGKGMTGLLSSGAGNLAGVLTTGAPASGGAFGAAAASGDLKNLFSEKPDLSNLDGGSGSYSYRSASERPLGAGSSPLAQAPPNIPQSTFNQSSGPTYMPFKNGQYMENWADFTPAQLRAVGADSRYATGGLIPAAGGVDTVPAMLSGGEFVMNAAATRNIGAGNLQALNSGAGVGDNTDLVSKLDELIIATETSQSTGDINITINGSTGAENQTGGQEATESQRQLSEKIKVAVKQVIADEQRLGGQLRR